MRIKPSTLGAVFCAAAVLSAVLMALWLGLFSSIGALDVDFARVAAPGAASDADDQRPRLRVAVGAMISPAATKHYYQELMQWLGDRVGMRTVLVQRRTYGEVNDLVRSRAIDLAFVCSGPYVQGHAEFGMEILVVPVVDGKTVYHSYILAKRASGITSFDDLRGRRFAFTDPNSNTGFLVPRYMLATRGESPEAFFRETFFTHSHDNSIKAVAQGLADGAAVDSLIWEFIERTAPQDVAETVVIEKSPPYGIPPVVVHPALDPDLKGKLKQALLSLHEAPGARDLLDKLNIDRFDEGSHSLYQTVVQMQDALTNTP